jgi:mRNA interferase RelE/StbE
VNGYTVYITPSAWKEIKELPAYVRQRARRAIDGMAKNPRPPRSKSLEVRGLLCEVRPFRLDRWRVVYAVTDADRLVDALAVRKRPPYDYGDLDTLLRNYPSK